MLTSPVKLCCLLPTPPPPHYDPDFRFQPRGRHEVFKHGRQVCIPPLPAPIGTNVLHFDMISLLISDAAPLLACPCDFHEESAHGTFSTW